MMPEGQRRKGYEKSLRKLVNDIISIEIVPFSENCVGHYAAIIAQRRLSGRPIFAMDAMIAAIALTHDMTLATRNIRDFEGLGVRLVNPFEAAA